MYRKDSGEVSEFMKKFRMGFEPENSFWFKFEQEMI